MHKRTTALAALALTAALVTAGCGDSDSDSSKSGGGSSSGTAAKKITLGLFTYAPTNDFWNLVTAGAKQEAERQGVKLIVNASTDDTDLGAGTSKIQNLLTQGVDGLVVVPLAPTFKPVLERALAKKVPVVCVNSCIDKWDGQTSFIETNNLHAGEIAGEYIQKLTGGAGTVGMLACIPGLQGCDDRINGAKSKLDSGLKVPAPLSVAGCQRDLAVKGTQNLITGNPGLKVLYGTCGQAALAAANVLRGAGKASVPVIGVDGVPQEMQAIISGKLNATVAQFPMRMGKLGVQQAIRALRGQPVTKHIYSGEELVTKDNVQQFIKDNFLPGMVKGT